MCKLATDESKLYERAVVVASPVIFCPETTKPTTPPLGFGSGGSRSIQYANPENYISTKHVDSALFAILKLSRLKAAILFPASKLYSLRTVG